MFPVELSSRVGGGAGQQVSSADLLARIPDEVIKRARLVFRSVLKYAYELLTTETNMNPPADLTFRADSGESRGAIQ